MRVPPMGVEGVYGEVVGPVNLHSDGAVGARHSDVDAEGAILGHELVLVRDAHEVQLLRHIHVEAAVERLQSRLLPHPARSQAISDREPQRAGSLPLLLRLVLTMQILSRSPAAQPAWSVPDAELGEGLTS